MIRLVRVTSGRTCVLAVVHIVVLADRSELVYDLPVALRDTVYAAPP